VHKGEVEVRFGEEFNGQPLPAEHHQAMEALWSAKTALNPLLFNGLKVHTLSATRACAAHTTDVTEAATVPLCRARANRDDR
jgi:hypothetical protein